MGFSLKQQIRVAKRGGNEATINAPGASLHPRL